jgi:hypothetical protein
MSIKKPREGYVIPRQWGAATDRDVRDLSLRVFGAELSIAAEAEFGFMKCPCCRTPMYRGRKGDKVHHQRETPTMAHDVPVAVGGNPLVWVHACLRCNNQQGSLTFAQWAAKLRRAGDRRAEHAQKLADFIDRWRRENGVPAMRRVA